MDFSIKRGDTAPAYVVTLTDLTGTGWDLESSAVVFTMRHLATGVLVIDHQACDIVDETTNVARYNWKPGDTDRVGLHIGEFEVTLGDGTSETFPDAGHTLINITEQADIVTLPEDGLCTVDEVFALMGDLNATEALLTMTVLIPRVEREAFAYLQHALVRRERTETDVPIYPSQVEVPLHYTPVVSITSVTLDGDAVPVGAYIMNRYGIFLDFFGPANAFGVDPTLAHATVTYVGGLSADRADIIKSGALLPRIARLLTKLRDDALGTDTVTAERYLVKYLSEGFTDDETKAMEPYVSQAGGLLAPLESDNWALPKAGEAPNWAAWS